MSEPTARPYTAPAPGAPTRRPGGLGRVALILALVVLGLGLVLQITNASLPFLIYRAGGSPQMLGAVLTSLAVLHLLLAAVPLVIGLVALTRRGEPHGAAGVAVGIGGTIVISTLVGLVASPLVRLALGG